MLTLDSLRQFDPNAPMPLGASRWRFACPECGAEKQHKRNLDVDSKELVYICRRCGIKGRLGDRSSVKVDRETQRKADAEEAKRKSGMWTKTRMTSLAGTPGETYLAGRGIPLDLARKCGVKFCPWFMGGPAVMFQVRNDSRVVAQQGRYIEVGELKVRTIGKVTQGAFATPGAWGEVLTITEAPIDALSLHLIGIPAIATCGTTLPAFVAEKAVGRVVMVATDADEAGDRAFETWRVVLREAASVERLRPEGAKDWNQIIMRTL